MNLKTKIIASEISNLTDARYFAAWGVDYLSYLIDDSDDRFIGSASILEIKDWVEGPKTLGLIDSIHVPNSLSTLYLELNLDGLIVSPFLSVAGLPEDYDRVYREFTVQHLNNKFSEEFLIFKSEKVTDVTENAEQLRSIAMTNELYIDGTFSLNEMDYILENIHPSGFVLRGGEEEKVGFKSYDELDQIFEHLEI